MRQGAILLLGLLALLACVLGQAAQDMTLYDAKPFSQRDNPCGPVCNQYKNICLPKWVDPHNRFPYHCVDDADLNRAPDRCVLCLKLNGVPQGSNNVAPVAPPDGDSCCDCDDPCGCVCLDYEDMCMPERIDPEGVIGARCEEHDDRYPPPQCVFCLLNHGLPASFADVLTTDQVSTTVTATATSIATSTQTTTVPNVDVDNSDFCAPVCGHYKDICLPQWVDPKNVFRPHCEDNDDVKRAPVRCVLCLKLNGVPSPPDTGLSRSPCCDCVDPCGCVCDYEDMCMPTELDPERRFQPQCLDVENYGHPTPWCVYCLRTRGLPGSFSGVGRATSTMPTTGTPRTPRSPATSAADLSINTLRTTRRNRGSKYIQTTRRPTSNSVVTSSRRTTMNPKKMISRRTTENPNKRAPERTTKRIPPERITKRIPPERTTEKLAPKRVTDNPKKITPERPTKKMVPESARNNPKRVTPEKTKHTQTAKQRSTTSSMVTPNAEPSPGVRRDACRQVCKGYRDICLPGWLDPWKVFTPHCEDVLYVGMPDIACLLCLKSHGVTPVRSRVFLDLLTPDTQTTTQPDTQYPQPATRNPNPIRPWKSSLQTPNTQATKPQYSTQP